METIVVPTDFSPAANNAVMYAARLAQYFNARMILLNAYPYPASGYEMGYPLPIISSLKDSAEERLNLLRAEVNKSLGRDLEIECLAEMGWPYEVIESVVTAQDADLIVIGIVGEAGNFKEHLIGSTAIRISRNLNVPTFIIPEDIKYRPIRKISFACDLEKTEETDLVYIAKYFCKIFNAELEVINVEPPEEEVTVERAKTSIFMESKLENVSHQTIYITGNDVKMELEDYLRSHATDLVMLNPKKHNLFYHLFNRSVTKELAFHARLPILAIH